MINATSLTRTFDRTVALRDVTLAISAGDMFALIGPHRAGKTTFFRMVSGVLHPTCGRLTTAHRTVGVVPQRFSLYPDLSVDENLRLRARLHDIDAGIARARGAELLARLGMTELTGRTTSTLPILMKQKLALVAALLTNPDLLLLDEPTTGMDPVARRDFWQVLHQLHHDGLTIVVATPYLDEAEYATRLGLLQEGCLLDVGTRAEIVARYPRTLIEVRSLDRAAVRARLREVAAVEDVFLAGAALHVRGLDNAPVLAAAVRRALDGVVPPDAVIPIQPSLADVFVLRDRCANGAAA
jgi:ABC-2 type transport system ATP-binding protein